MSTEAYGFNRSDLDGSSQGVRTLICTFLIIVIIIAIGGMFVYGGSIKPFNEMVCSDIEKAQHIKVSPSGYIEYTIIKKDGSTMTAAMFLPKSFSLVKDPAVGSYGVTRTDEGRPYMLTVKDYNTTLYQTAEK